MFEGVCEPTVDGVQQADPFALATALRGLTLQRVHDLSAEDAECVVAATQRVINVLSACQGAAIDRYTDHVITERQADQQRAGRVLVGAPSPEQVSAGMLAPILRVAPRTMLTRISSARWLNLLPRTAALAWAGDLEPYRVAVITGAAQHVSFDDLLEFEARVHHGDLRPMACSRVKTRATAVAARLATGKPVNPAAPLPRWVRVQPDSQPGVTRWDALLPADVSQRMWAAVQALAGQYRHANPDLSPDQSRADALTDLVLGNAQVSTTALLSSPPPPHPTRTPAPHPSAPLRPPRGAPRPPPRPRPRLCQHRPFTRPQRRGVRAPGRCHRAFPRQGTRRRRYGG